MNQRIIGEMNSPLAMKAFDDLISDPGYKNDSHDDRADSLDAWLSTAFSEAKKGLLALDDEVGDFLIDKQLDRIEARVTKIVADAAMTATAAVLGEETEVIFSRSKQKLFGTSQK